MGTSTHFDATKPRPSLRVVDFYLGNEQMQTMAGIALVDYDNRWDSIPICMSSVISLPNVPIRANR